MQDTETVIGILAVIATIRGRKQQPTKERICEGLSKSFNVEKAKAIENLNKCVSDGIVAMNLETYWNAKTVLFIFLWVLSHVVDSWKDKKLKNFLWG